MNLTPRHHNELKASGLSAGIIAKYFLSVAGDDAREWLIGDAVDALGSHSEQYVTAPYARLLDQSEHILAGGWVCTANGQIKPDEPRIASQKQDDGSYQPIVDRSQPDGLRRIKYETKRGGSWAERISLMSPEAEPRKAADGSRLVVITEGGKKAGALATLGYEVIALPGVDMACESDSHGTKHLIPALKSLALEGAEFIFAFDADKAQATRKGVARAILRQAPELETMGGEVSVASWAPNHGKGFDDMFVAMGAEFARSAIADAVGFDAWQKSLPKSWVSKPRPAGYSTELKRIEKLHAAYNAQPVADVVLNQRYLDKGELPAPGSVLLVDSAMGTGKTSSLLAGIVEQQRAKHPDAIGISSAYRNILLRQSGAALGFTHWLDTDGDPSLGKFGYLAACPESLPKLANQNIPEGSLLLADEVVAWLRHIFCSDTMKNGADRIAVLSAVKTILEKIRDGGGYVVGLEAGIPQWAVDCFRDLFPAGTPITLMRNEFSLKANQKAFFYDKLTAFKTEQQAMVLRGARLVAASDSATQIDKQYRPMFDTEKDFFISAQNSSDDDAQRFAADPQAELFARGGLRVLGFSPTIGAGVSIDDVEGREPWFDSKTGIFTHLTSSDAAQQMARYRRSTPMHIFCKEKANGIGDGDLAIFDPAGLRARWHDDAKYCHQLVNISEYLAGIDGESLVKTLERSLAGELPSVAMLDKWRSIITAVDNFDRLHLRDNLKERLKADGYEIVEVACENTPGKSEEFKELREQAETESGEEFAALVVPESLTPDEARSILSSHGHTRQQTLEARKALYQFEFPQCDFNNADFCKTWLVKNKGKKLSQLRDEWAARNPEAAKAIDRWHLKGKLKQAANLNEGVSMADVSRKSPAADIFAKAQLPQAIDAIGSELYTGEHPEVVRVVDWVNSNQDTLKKVFRMKFNDERSNLDIFNSFARKLGYMPRAEKQARKGESREKQYVLSDFSNPERGHMLKALSDKFAAKLEQKGETMTGESLKPKTDWGVSAATLEQRQAQLEPVAIPAPSLSEIGTVETTKNVPWDWADFERELIEAATAKDLQTTKTRYSEPLRRRVMSAWQQDGRFDWLAKKSQILSQKTAMATT